MTVLGDKTDGEIRDRESHREREVCHRDRGELQASETVGEARQRIWLKPYKSLRHRQYRGNDECDLSCDGKHEGGLASCRQRLNLTRQAKGAFRRRCAGP